MPRRTALQEDNDLDIAVPPSDEALPLRRRARRPKRDELADDEILSEDDTPRRRRLRDAARAASTDKTKTRALSTQRSSKDSAKHDTSKDGAAKTDTAMRKVRHDAPLLAAPSKTPPRALSYEIAGVLSVALGLLLLINALRPAEGVLTQIGVMTLRHLFGIGAIALPVLMCVLGVLLIVRRHKLNLRAFSRGALLGFWMLITAAHLGVPRGKEFLSREVLAAHGGWLGGGSAWMLRKTIGETGAIIFLAALFLVMLLLWSEVSLAQLGTRFSEETRNLLRGGRDNARRVLENDRAALRAHDAEQFQDAAHADAEYAQSETVERPAPRRPMFIEERPRPDGMQPQIMSVDELLAMADTEIKSKRRASTRGAIFDEELDGTPENLAGEPLPRAHPPQENETTFFEASMQEQEAVVPPVASSDALRVLEALNADAGEPQVSAPHTIAPPVSTQETLSTQPTANPQPAANAQNNVITQRAAAPPQPASEKAPAQPDEVRIEFTDAPPPASVIADDDEHLTPVEKLEAQAIASATGGEAAPAKKRIEKPRRRFGEGPLMPEYFDDAVRALDPPIIADVTGVEEHIREGVQAVTDTLNSFKIDARVTDVKRGPVITRYEVQPAPGVRVASIANLDRDMARALSALSVRIEAPVPGKDVVGIEVPNKKVHLVRLRDVLERQEFLAAPSKLAFVLGKDIAGNPKWADLTKMPHMLIAGATNSGKSVCLNSIIASILVRATPEEVKFSLIDPKRVELTLYKGIRHLLHDVVVEPKDAVRALRAAIAEMDRRYKAFAERGVRNIASYNAKLEEGEAPMAYHVIVIDELADLMMTAAAEFEKLICRLAQLARATGIHLIVATQRPSVNVITGVIKANIPSRIAFAVASQVDSRTILDSVGAERLIGSGDMLFDANNGGKATRIQGAFLSEEEVNRVVQVVKAHYADDPEPFIYETDLSSMSDDDDEGSSSSTRGENSDKRDSLYDEILEFVRTKDEMSASMIQRKFEIGYPRAGRIVDQLERDGVLSAADGPKPRKVIGAGS